MEWLLVPTWRTLALRGSLSATSSTTGLSVAKESCFLRWTSSCLNSSWVLVSRSFCLKEMSENIVANVLPSSIAVLVLFYKENYWAIKKQDMLLLGPGHWNLPFWAGLGLGEQIEPHSSWLPSFVAVLNGWYRRDVSADFLHSTWIINP